MNKRLRYIALIIWIIVGLSVIGLGISFFKDNQLDLKFLKKEYEGPASLFRKEVIQEESLVIETVKEVSPSVVSIIVETINIDLFSGPSLSEEGIGTGFIVDKNGLIVTNSHVVEDPSGEYSIVTNDGQTYEVEKINLDRVTDIAILEITARDLPVIELGDSDNIQVGQSAIAIGNALGKFQNTVTTGVISGVARQLRASSYYGAETKIYENAIQTDAALNPGNSGGPLLNSSGQVIGINVATTYGADNISFAIPINDLKPLLKTFLEQGKIVRPYLGISYVIITPELSQLRDLPEGAFISGVVPDTPAAAADLQRGDIITQIDDEKITEENSLAKVITQYGVGDSVNLVVDREGELINKKVVLTEAPEKF